MAPAGATAVLQPRWAWGAAAAQPGGLAYVDDTTLAYLCGSSVVLYQPDTKTQRFVAGAGEGRVTAFAACPARRMLALAQRAAGAEAKATITLFDLQTLKRRKILTAPGEGTKEFVSLAFSADGRYLAAQGGAPDWALCLWLWEKSKLVASARTASAPGQTVVQCLFQPGEDPQYMSVVGEGTCALYQIEAGNSLRAVPTALPRREHAAFTCHAWLADNDAAPGALGLVVGTRRGEVLVVGEGEVRQALALEGGAAVEALAVHSRGFVAGTSGGGLAAFERDSEAKPYRLATTFGVEPQGSSSSVGAAASPTAAAATSADGVPAFSAPPTASGTAAAGAGAAPAPAKGIRACSLAVCPADESVACLTSDGQLLALAPAPGGRRGVFAGLQRLAPGFHSGPITGMATCVRRPIVATAGVDRTLRLWNWQDKSAELVKAFDEEASSLALHPGGYLLAAGFADRLRLMSVLADDLRVVRELPIKAARDLAFSNGGAYLAAANGNNVHVWCAYTAAPLAVLRGHNAKVRGLWWSADDACLVTGGADGAVYEWHVLEGRRARDFVQKGWAYTALAGMHAPGSNPANPAAVAGGPTTVFMAAADKQLRVLEEPAGGGGLAVATEVDAGAVLTQLVAPGPGGRLLFAATEDGAVRAYRLPLAPGAEHQALRCGTAPITRLAATRDETLLFAATADGCLLALDVRDRDVGRFLTEREGERLPWAEEVLVARGDIEERRERMAELEAQVAEAGAQAEYQLKLRDLALGEKVRELADKAAGEAAAAAAKYNALLADRGQLEALYEARLAGAEDACAAQLAALDAQFQARLVHEMERYQELSGAQEASVARYEQEAAQAAERHAAEVAALHAAHADQMAAERARYGALAAAMDGAGREAGEVRRQMEEDVDREVEELKERYRRELAGEAEANLRLKGENGLLRKRFDEQAKAIEAGQAQLRAADAEKRQLAGVIEGLRRDVAALQRDVQGRDDAIAEKERRILDLKHKAQELEKFKFVLEYSIGELRAALEPKDAQLAAMRQRLEEMEGLVGEVGRAHSGAALELEGRKAREAGLQREIARQRGALAEAAHRIKLMQRDIALAAELIQDPERLKASVVRLLREHAQPGSDGPSASKLAGGKSEGGGEAGGPSAEASVEAQRRAAQQERMLAQLRGALDSERRSAAATQRRLVGENSELIRQIRELQGEASGKAARGAGAGASSGASSGCPTRASPSRTSACPSACGGSAAGSRCGSKLAGSGEGEAGEAGASRSGGSPGRAASLSASACNS